MAEEVRINSATHLANILSDIAFAPSCVDMGWGWEVEEVFTIQEREKRPVMQTSGYRLRTTFRRPDRSSGVVSTGYGRWWEVPQDVTTSGVVKTAFAAAKMILEHELMESFKWNGIRIFDPHNNVLDLAQINQRKD